MTLKVFGLVFGSAQSENRIIDARKPLLIEDLMKLGRLEAAKQIDAMLASPEREENMRGLGALKDGCERGLFSRPEFAARIYRVGLVHPDTDVQLEAVNMLFEATSPGKRGVETIDIACRVPSGHYIVRDYILERLAEDFKLTPEDTVLEVKQIALRTRYSETGVLAAGTLRDFQAWLALAEVFIDAVCSEARTAAYRVTPPEHRMGWPVEIPAV